MRIDNSRVVREVDRRAHRDLWALLLLVGVLVLGAGLYAWPHLQHRQTTIETERMNRERERLVEENRKLRLEKAALENLDRVETIAERDLGMRPPAPERTIVVEVPAVVPPGTRLASRAGASPDPATPPTAGARN